MIESLMNSDIFLLLVVPALILVARVIDVTMGTIRVIFISKGEKLLSAAIGFFEVLIWLLAITSIMNNLNNVFAYIAYAGGFAIGTYLGIMLETKILIGKVIVRIITHEDSIDLLDELRRKRYTFTCLGVDGPDGEVKSLHVIIHKKDLKKLLDFVLKHDKRAYYSVEDAKIVTENGLVA